MIAMATGGLGSDAVSDTEWQWLPDMEVRCRVVTRCSGSRNNDGEKDLVSIELARHHLVHDAQRTSSTMPVGRPHEDTSTSIAIVLTKAAGC